MKHLVLETPEIPKHIIWKFLDDTKAKNDKVVVDALSKMRPWRSKCSKRDLVNGRRNSWADDELEVHVDNIIDCVVDSVVAKALVEVGERENRRVEEQQEKDKLLFHSRDSSAREIDEKKERENKAFLGENNLGKIEPVRLM